MLFVMVVLGQYNTGNIVINRAEILFFRSTLNDDSFIY